MLTRATRELTPVSDTPRLDAELLLAHSLGITREALLLGPDRPVPPAFDALLRRRLAHEPVAYMTGRKAFWTLELDVTPAVLIPRPDSETLIEAAMVHFEARTPSSVLDLGTGSGALLLAALDHWPEAQGLGVDRSADALEVAHGNACRLGFETRARFVRGDWAAGIEACFDLILCNPPYVEADAALPPGVAAHEPSEALYAGADGLDAYRQLVPSLLRLIAPGGVACLEIGTTQAAAVRGLVDRAGLKSRVVSDLSGRERCVVIFDR